MSALAGWTRGQWALRAVMVLGLLGAQLATGLLGEWPPWWAVLLMAVVAGIWVAVPESVAGIVGPALVLAWWGIAFRDGLHPQALVAAAALLAAHLAALVAAYGPPQLAVDPATVWLWVRRGLLALLLAPLTWALAELVRGQPEPAGVWLSGLAVAVAATWLAGALMARSQED